MAAKILTTLCLEELRREIPSSRKCLENLTDEIFGFKPHESSMEMQYVALLVAEIPQWIHYMLKEGELDFATYPAFEFKTANELVAHFDDCVQKAEKALEEANDDALEKRFTLKRDGKALYSAPLSIDIPTTLNHWVHHRGQLTVYMRMMGLKIPSIYGPSGDDKDYNTGA